MINDETGNGGIKISSCGSEVIAFSPFLSKFNIGDSLFIIKKARKGLLRKVVIKDIRIEKKFKTNDVNLQKVVYVDTFNALWYEKELCTRQDAEMLVAEYQQYLQSLLDNIKICK